MSFFADFFDQGKSESQVDSQTSQKIDITSAPAPQVMGTSVAQADRGMCRICFETGGDLIAPCLCDGTSKWIHRSCLDRWRASGTNPRALTNCPSCAFQYHLKLKRVLSDDGKERQRQFLQRLGGQTVLAFVGVQLAILCLAILIRICDPQEKLVNFLHLPQDSGYKDLHTGTFIQALRHHKLTYYICGLVALLGMFGLGVMGAACGVCLCGSPSGPGPQAIDNLSCCICCMDTCRCTLDCGICCQECVCAPCTGDVVCPDIVPDTRNCDCGNQSETFLIFLLVIIIAAIVIGIIAAVIGIVMTAQQAIKRYARLEETRILSQEYIVVDLADPEDGKDEMVIAGVMGQDEQHAQREIARDLSRIFQTGVAEPLRPSYGAVGV